MKSGHLFKVNKTTYSVHGAGRQKALAYLRARQIGYRAEARYLRPDNMTHEQQWKSGAVAMFVPAGWKIPNLIIGGPE